MARPVADRVASEFDRNLTSVPNEVFLRLKEGVFSRSRKAVRLEAPKDQSSARRDRDRPDRARPDRELTRRNFAAPAAEALGEQREKRPRASRSA